MKGMKISVQKITLAAFWRMDCGGGEEGRVKSGGPRQGAFGNTGQS